MKIQNFLTSIRSFVVEVVSALAFHGARPLTMVFAPKGVRAYLRATDLQDKKFSIGPPRSAASDKDVALKWGSCLLTHFQDGGVMASFGVFP